MSRFRIMMFTSFVVILAVGCLLRGTDSRIAIGLLNDSDYRSSGGSCYSLTNNPCDPTPLTKCNVGDEPCELFEGVLRCKQAGALIKSEHNFAWSTPIVAPKDVNGSATYTGQEPYNCLTGISCRTEPCQVVQFMGFMVPRCQDGHATAWFDFHDPATLQGANCKGS